VLDVVGTGGGEPGLLRHPWPDVRVSAAVPPDLALARRDPAVRRYRAFDAERAGVARHHEELLLHGERDLHRLPGEQRERGDQRLELDVELTAEPAAEERHFDPH